MRGSEPYRQCWCRDPATGKPLRANCPKLKNKKHGKWYARYDAGGTEGKRRQPVVGPFERRRSAKTSWPARWPGSAAADRHLTASCAWPPTWTPISRENGI